MRWGTIVPLIGGLTVAGKKVTGVDPEVLLSYTPFSENEVNVKHNFPNVPHYNLDEPDFGGFDVSKHKDLDFMQALCPCAGLSMLSSGSKEQRAKMNTWMIESAKYILGTVRPKVFWGENAPQLYTNSGTDVRSLLRDIGEQNGYTFSMYLTNTLYHGIPQGRKRSFYFFWKDTGVPEFEYYRRPHPGLSEYLSEVTPGISHHQDADLKAAEKHLLENPYIMYLQEKYNGHGIDDMRRYLVEKDVRGITLLSYLIKTEQLTEARDWFKARGITKYENEVNRVMTKLSSGRGFWDGSFPIYRGDWHFATLVGRTVYAIHPDHDRTLTTRECMHLMGLPEDFELASGALNHVCQNVPVMTGSDMTAEVVAYLRGQKKMLPAGFVMQNNLNMNLDVQQSTLLSF